MKKRNKFKTPEENEAKQMKANDMRTKVRKQKQRERERERERLRLNGRQLVQIGLGCVAEEAVVVVDAPPVVELLVDHVVDGVLAQLDELGGAHLSGCRSEVVHGQRSANGRRQGVAERRAERAVQLREVLRERIVAVVGDQRLYGVERSLLVDRVGGGGRDRRRGRAVAAPHVDLDAVHDAALLDRDGVAGVIAAPHHEERLAERLVDPDEYEVSQGSIYSRKPRVLAQRQRLRLLLLHGCRRRRRRRCGCGRDRQLALAFRARRVQMQLDDMSN